MKQNTLAVVLMSLQRNLCNTLKIITVNANAMTQEEIDLLTKDLCARLPYGVKVKFAGYSGREDCTLNVQHLNSTYSIEYLRMKPYLRPMSSMSKSEWEEYKKAVMTDNNIHTGCVVDSEPKIFTVGVRGMDFLNEHCFDYRDLIQLGLALEAPEGMYNF